MGQASLQREFLQSIIVSCGDRVNLRRPLTAAVAAAGKGTFVLDGVARMRERPIQDLVDGLSQLGVQAECTMGTGCPPVTVQADGLPSGTVSPLSLLMNLQNGYHTLSCCVSCWPYGDQTSRALSACAAGQYGSDRLIMRISVTHPTPGLTVFQQ